MRVLDLIVLTCRLGQRGGGHMQLRRSAQATAAIQLELDSWLIVIMACRRYPTLQAMEGALPPRSGSHGYQEEWKC